jgi:hypothetical protein
VGHGACAQALAAATVFFVLTTALHTAVHAWFGWRFQRGIEASQRGDHVLARRLLSPVTRRGMSHYDEEGHARAAYDRSGE